MTIKEEMSENGKRSWKARKKGKTKAEVSKAMSLLALRRWKKISQKI